MHGNQHLEATGTDAVFSRSQITPDVHAYGLFTNISSLGIRVSHAYGRSSQGCRFRWDVEYIMDRFSGQLRLKLNRPIIFSIFRAEQ